MGEAYNASLFITFKVNKSKNHQPIGDEWVRVQKWKNKVKQCTKCSGLNHNASRCKAAQLCAECGKDHPGDCIAETKYCVNCKHSGHGSKDSNCPILKRENAIIVLRKQHKIGYLRAREVYNKMHRNSTNLGQRHSIGRNRTEFRRKQPNIVQASQNKIPNYTPNSLVGQSWLQPKTVQASKVGNTTKSQGGPKYFPNKTNKTSFKHQPPSLDGGNTNGLSPQIHNSQIAGSSKMDTPWIAPKTKKTKQKNKNMQKK